MRSAARVITGRIPGHRVLVLALAMLALLGLLAACGGDDDTPTPTRPAPTDGTGDGTGDGVTATEVPFKDRAADFDWELQIPSERLIAWHPVTLKRVVEDQFPNMSITLTSSRINETLVDLARSPEKAGTELHWSGPTVWGLYGTERVLTEGVPDPGRAAMPLYGIYPGSQFMILTEGSKGINNLFDLDGRTTNMGQDPDSIGTRIQQEMFDIGGIKPRIVISTERSSGIAEGSFDAWLTGIVFQLTTSGDVIPFQTTNQLRIIDYDFDLINQVHDAHPEWDFMFPMRMCNSAMRAAMNLDYDVFDPEFEGSFSIPGDNCIAAPGGRDLSMYGFPEVPEEAMYNVMRAQFDNPEEFALTFPGAPWAGNLFMERIGHTSQPQADYHPGVRRAYEEYGVTYGIEGIAEWFEQRTDPDRWWLDFLPQE